MSYSLTTIKSNPWVSPTLCMTIGFGIAGIYTSLVEIGKLKLSLTLFSLTGISAMMYISNFDEIIDQTFNTCTLLTFGLLTGANWSPRI